MTLNQEAFSKALAAGFAAYEAASKEGDGWIEWLGGECPVDSDALVDVRFLRGNQIGHYEASFWDWEHVIPQDYARYGGNIIAYRLAK